MFVRVALIWSIAALIAGTSQARQADKSEVSDRSVARPHLQAAVGTARWIMSHEVRTQAGKTWPIAPEESSDANTALYHGSSGVVLFFLELHAASGDAAYLNEALAGADHLVAEIPKDVETIDAGLYTGLAGVAFTLHEVHKASRTAKYRDAALRCVDLIVSRAKKSGRGVEWNNSPDIIRGGAGIGLFLLYAAREIKRPDLADLALRAGRRIVELGQRRGSGLMWPIAAGSERNMPNFSHGTAGVAYFLATLYHQNHKQEFLDAALLGGRYLTSIANTDKQTCLVFHNDPGGTERYYLGWCHGPPGTARLFHRLAQTTSDKTWTGWLHKSARAVVRSGIPAKRTSGFWNNVGQCCGSAGVADFFLSLHRATGHSSYLEFAHIVTADLLKRAARDESGLKWVQAEHRVRPDDLAAQTGYMQGAAGIGMLLLHLDGQEQGRARLIKLPDSPF